MRFDAIEYPRWAFNIASNFGYTEKVRDLLLANVVGDEANHALVQAADKGHLDIVQLLVSDARLPLLRI
jgi:hypothetical protein